MHLQCFRNVMLTNKMESTKLKHIHTINVTINFNDMILRLMQLEYQGREEKKS